MNNQESFNERFERLLLQNNLQKKDIAALVGISPNGISTWKITGTIPRADIAVKIAKVLNVTTEYLITGELSGLDSEDKKNNLAYKVARLSADKQKVVKALVDALEVF